MNLLHYIKGFRKGKEAHRIESEAMKDPFLSEALEGYDLVKGDHSARILQMQKRVDKLTRKRSGRTFAWSIAASILLCLSLGGGYYMMFYKNSTKDLYTGDLNIGQKTTPEIPTVIKPEVQQPETPGKVATEEVVTEKITPKEVITKKTKNPETLKEKPAKNSAQPTQQQYPSQPDASPAIEEDIKTEEFAHFGDKQSKESSFKEFGSGKLYIGKVIDRKTGEPLIGANVYSKSYPSLGTLSDTAGIFNLKISDPTSPVVANYLGYLSMEIQPDTQSLLFSMNEDTRELSEVVVTGYSVQKKATTTGSISSVSTSSLKINDKKPEPVTGMKAFKKYLEENLIPPTDEACQGAKGKVVLKFHVDSYGRPIDIRVDKSLCPSADEEAIRLLNAGCNWTQGGKEVEIKVEFGER